MIPSQYGRSDILILSGTEFDYLIITDHHPTHLCNYSPVPTGERWLAILKKNPGIVRLLLKEGNLSHGDWMKAIILIIHDEESIRFSFVGLLASEGHNVITADGYPEALARMDETKFKLILADIVLDGGMGNRHFTGGNAEKT